MFSLLVGLTGMEVSLCGLLAPSQSVLTFAPVCVGVVQIAVPVLTAGPVPNTAPVTGAGASLTLCVKLIGCGLSSPSAAATLAPSASAAATSTMLATRVRLAFRFRELI